MGLGAAVRAKLSTPTSRFFNLSYRGPGRLSQSDLDPGRRDAADKVAGGGRHSCFRLEFTHQMPEMTKRRRHRCAAQALRE
jgi:hypothetical protein